MQSEKQKGAIFLMIVVALAALSGWLYTRRDFAYGLDVRGGTRFTLELAYDKDPQKAETQRKNLATIQTRLVSIISNRIAQGLGVNESTVQAKGEQELVVEIPGVKEIDKARELIVNTASIKAYHAENVNTDKISFREFTDNRGHETDKTGSPYVTFQSRTNPNKKLTPTDPEYKRMLEGWKLILEGDDLKRAFYEVQGSGNAQPHFEFSDSGAAKMEAWTRSIITRPGEKLAFVLDGRVLSIAPVKEGQILSDNAYIDGTFDPTYIKNLTMLLNSGALPMDLKETSSSVIDPTIGKGAFDQMVQAGIGSAALIALFLIVYYAFPGIVALVALGLYMLFTLTVMKLIGATLSLAGLAGFILSVGMAVDANILVFERTKEEMREGRKLMTAVELGFKRAFPAILDSNACTILTSMVLWYFGTGLVKGFATTLIIGVAISLFTAVVCTRSLLVFLVSSGIGANPKQYAMDRSWFGEKYEKSANENPLKVMEKSNRWFLISLLTIIPGAIFLFLGGIKPNVEFRGGIEAEFIQPANSAVTTAQIESNLVKAGFQGPIVKVSSTPSGKLVSVTVGPKSGTDPNDPKARKEVEDAVGLGIPANNYATVGPTIQKETLENAYKGIILSSALIVLYLAIRFGVALGGVKNGLKFGLSAIGALIHDVLVVIGIAAIVGYLMNWQVSSLFVTAMLTVIGFSVHDTIVIFDRVRENLRKPMAGESFLHLCNRSVSQSFGRSINTSMTVIATLIIMIIMGTPTIDLKFFCVTMLTGILSGTYSSIFNATPILYLWDRMTARTKGEDKTLVAEALREANRLRAVQVTAMANTASETYGTVKRRKGVKQQARQDLDE